MASQTPSKRRFEKTRRVILDAARKILIDDGQGGLSIRRLAEQVDYSPAAIYKYFASKEEIIAALRQEAWQLMASYETDIPSDSSLTEQFVQSGRSYVDFATKYPEYYLLILNSTDSGPDSLEAFEQDPNFAGLLQSVDALVEAGEFQIPGGYAPFHLAMLSWFTVHAVALLKLTMMSKCAEEFDAASVEVMNLIKDVFSVRKSGA